MNAVAGRSLRAEWTKLRSLRSTTWTAIAVVAVTVGFTAFAAAVGGTDANEAGRLGDDDVVVNGLRGVWLGQVAMVALGAAVATSEFSTGTIRTTFTAVPHRLIVLGTKAAVVGAVALLVASVASVSSFLVAQPLLHRGGYVPPAYPIVPLLDPSAIRAVTGTALYLTLLALLALAVGTIVRHAAAAMTLVVGAVLAPTVLMEFFTGAPRELLQRVAPTAGLAIQVTTDRYDTPPLGPWGGLGVTAAWTLAALIAAAWTIGRRDV